MNFKAASLALRHIRATKPRTAFHRLVLRIAARKIKQAMSAEYDVMFRLQTLEGVAGIPKASIGIWWQKGRRGLKAAMDTLGETKIQPEWFSSRDTGMASYLLRAADNAVRQYRLTHISGEDILQNALMGLKIDGSQGESFPAYSVGKAGASKIQDGKESPKSAAHGIAKLLKRKVDDETKKLRRLDRLPEAGTEEGGEVDLPGKVSPEDPAEFFNWFGWITFENMNHPLGKKIRRFMRKTWEGTGQEEPMNLWLDTIESGKRLKMREVADLAGISHGTFSSRHFTPAWRRFSKAIWSSPLVREIRQTAAEEGILWIPAKPDLEQLVDEKGRPILRKRKRSFREMVGRVSFFWMPNW